MSGVATKKMLRKYEQRAPVTKFFTGMFQTPPENFHTSESVEIDLEREDEDIAIAIQDLTTGVRMNADNIYTNKEFVPPIFDEAFTINAWDTIKRYAGQNPFEQPNFQAQASAQFLKGMRKVEDKIWRSIELQCAEVLQNGTLTLYDGSGNALYSIDYKPKAAHFLTAGTAWDAVGGDPVSDLATMAESIRNNGQGDANKIIMGIDAWKVAIEDTDFKALFETRRADLGRITPMETNGEGGHFRGIVEIGNYSLEMWTYGGRYKHPQTGVLTPYLDPANVIMMIAGRRLDLTFGEIPIVVPPEKRILPLVPSRVRSMGRMEMTTNSWVSPDGKNLFGSVGTRPLAIPTAIDSFGCIYTGV